MEFPANAETVFAMFCNPTYLELKCAQSATGAFKVSGAGAERVIMVERSLDEVPDSYRKFLGSELIIKEEQNWSSANESAFQAKWQLTLDGKPVNVTGTLQLTDTPHGSTLLIDAEVEVHIPFFGSMAEGFIREHFSKVISNERAIGLQWLSVQK